MADRIIVVFALKHALKNKTAQLKMMEDGAKEKGLKDIDDKGSFF